MVCEKAGLFKGVTFDMAHAWADIKHRCEGKCEWAYINTPDAKSQTK